MLYNHTGDFLDYGYGKGDVKAAIAGAMFEAAEHWFGQFPNSLKDNVRYWSSRSFSQMNGLAGYLPTSIIGASPDGIMAFREYRRILGGDSIIYPLALSSPKYVDDLHVDQGRYQPDSFDYSALGRYCSNSGVAIGTNELEATIHGVLEAVERDTLSSFLVDTFLRRERTSLRVIRHGSLPNHLRTLVSDVENEVRHQVLLLEMKNRYGIPVFCATLVRSKFEIEIVGFGCSLSRDHAAIRSLYELAQCYHAAQIFHRREFADKAKKILQYFADHKFHLRCAKLKIAEWGERIGFQNIEFVDTACLDYSDDLERYMDILVNSIEKAGRRVYHAVVNKLLGEQVITHSFIDDQDHFFCVTEGSFVLPNRGLAANSSAVEATTRVIHKS
ncbi:YcaO-like family protein [Sinorhizobium meliloti]|nr:YcaO-like family protein [Sinorhizobium meliloti]RVG22842.1 hypothetical protein CN225_33230 [Sinorhizobium meliloti]